MSLRQLGGCALLANAVIGILFSVELLIGGGNIPTPITIVQLVGFLLFIAGLPAIWPLQPQTGRLGQVGLALMGLGAGIAFIVVAVYLSGSNINSLVPLSSAVAALVGTVLVGWLTVRAGVFPTWIGWFLLATGILNFVTGYLPSGTIDTILDVVAGLALTAPIAGYGWIVVQRSPAVHGHQQQTI